ncbi:hypothetical protein COCNU_06G003760 [Cocos nucifera]|uniref:Uncharacterized protein n=1 Tax=Cocos nucifera TaxID=13894 RepID=A0A8K0IB54_COCNU|nr:hypothetical protein COCNU_06G003760 [Cocos nucifera]
MPMMMMRGMKPKWVITFALFIAQVLHFFTHLAVDCSSDPLAALPFPFEETLDAMDDQQVQNPRPSIGLPPKTQRTPRPVHRRWGIGQVMGTAL